MRWIIVATGVLIALAVVAAAAGYFIPQTRITARSAVLPASLHRVWAAITTVTEYPKWRRDVKAVEAVAPVDGRPAWRERVRHGTIACRVDEMTPPRRLVVRITDRNLTYGGTWTHELTEAGAGTRVTITERGEITHPMCRGLARFVFGYAGNLDTYLSALHRELSPGQSMPLDSRPQGA